MPDVDQQIAGLTRRVGRAREALSLDRMGAVVLEPWRRKWVSDEYNFASLQLDGAIGRKWQAEGIAR